jgi:type II secretory pathway pseudopilin PulG
LVEAMIVVGLLAVVLAGLLVGFQRARDGADDGEATKRIVVLTDVVRDLYRGQESYANVTTQQIIDSGMVPSDWRNGNTIVFDLGVLNFAPADRLGFEDAAFSVTATDLRRSTCLQSLLDVRDVFERIEINGVVVKDGAADPLTLEDVIANCGGETGNTFTGIAW